MKSIGIISGAGPYAGIVLHQKIIKLFNDKGCKKDNEFPLIQHISYPFSSTDVEGVIDFELSKKELATAIEMCGNVHKIVLACNSLLPSLSNKHKSLVLDPRDVIKNKYFNESIIVLASVSSVRDKVYSNLSRDVIYPDEKIQEHVSSIIEQVMSGLINQDNFSSLIYTVNALNPSSKILLGCTELCVFSRHINTINILDIISENLI